MKKTLLNLISLPKRERLESYIDKAISFYGSNFSLEFTNDSLSSFSREVIDSSSSNGPVPLGKIIISKLGKTEQALVHEILHMVLPLQTEFYVSEKTNADMYNFTPVLNNIVEHELILKDFLALGYSIDDFLHQGFNKTNYGFLKNEPPLYWKYEYFRIVMTKNHVNNIKKKEGEKAIAEMKKYGIQRHPTLEASFKDIYVWIKMFKEDFSISHAQKISLLLRLFEIGEPKQYLSPNGSMQLAVNNF
ncbi:hypothetical protein EZ456_09940 [Pedobacter psychrodurus]|uniref:Uncharacterized protein n=1 Tax=Pedobacter psychrodurus TaxID=2530456 RepID=A0A4R0Q3X1_9SPHI|nr:hypothetical protein [Pedobacter psychrodurus]TCD27502.1 hypothetical protein EZ456_09940 [Pedobacter psychrodurus]